MLHSFGLDISDHSLKLAQIQPSFFGLRIVSCAQTPLADGIVVGGEIKNETLLTEQIRALLRSGEKPVSTPYVTLSLPDQKTFTKLLLVPPGISPTQSWVENELERHIPIPKDELIVDWTRTRDPEETGRYRRVSKIFLRSKKDEPKYSKERALRRLTVVAAEKKTVERFVSVLHQCGLVPVALETEAEAIVRALAIPPEAKTVQAIMDLGASQTKIIYLEGSSILFILTVPLGGTELSHAIAEKLSIPIPEAEQAKMICGFDEKKCHGAVAKILTEYAARIARELANANVFYREHVGGTEPLRKVFLVGGNATLYQINERIAQLAGVPVTSGNPLARFPENHPALFPKRDTLLYTTAIGLALRDVV